jgi:hypothetical protein
MKPIWYFVGLILFVIGLIITITGIYHWINPVPNPKILAGTHPDVWWGAIMVIVGLVYILKNKNVKIN